MYRMQYIAGFQEIDWEGWRSFVSQMLRQGGLPSLTPINGEYANYICLFLPQLYGPEGGGYALLGKAGA